MVRSSDAKERLINSILELVAERSYTNVGVQEICEYASAKKGSFYYFFKSKQELMMEALNHHALTINELILKPAFASGFTIGECTERMFDLTYKYQKSLKENTGRVNGCFFGNLALELSTQDELIRHRIDKIFLAQTKLIKFGLEEANINTPRDDIDFQQTSKAILAYWEGVILMAKVQNDPGIIRTLGKNVSTLIAYH